MSDVIEQTSQLDSLLHNINQRHARVAVIGLGYVGLPLLLNLLEKNFPVTGYDIDTQKIVRLEKDEVYIKQYENISVANHLKTGKLKVTSDPKLLGEADVIIICVPTPLTRNKEPDISFVVATTRVIAQHLKKNALVILESTTYPETTAKVVKPILENNEKQSGKDFFLAYSPEREDPGNQDYDAVKTAKVVGADDPESLKLADAVYSSFVKQVVPVSSAKTAEAVKLTENIFRSVNIALVNELKVIYASMGIDIWEVIDAAKTKPFGYMPFYPGPGLGGHCIPIDPFYLTWKAKEYEVPTRFIELAGQINSHMPNYVIAQLREALDARSQKALSLSRVLMIGLAYKKGVNDLRESPSLAIMSKLIASGVDVAYHDPYIPTIPETREYIRLHGRQSIELTKEAIQSYDAVLITTDHDEVDYQLLADNASIIIDTRNAMSRAQTSGNVIKA